MPCVFLFISSLCLVDLDKGYGPLGPGSYLPGNSGATLQTPLDGLRVLGLVFLGTSSCQVSLLKPLPIPWPFHRRLHSPPHAAHDCCTHSLLSPGGESVGSLQNVLEDEWHCSSTTEKSCWPDFCTLYVNICLSHIWRWHTQHGKKGRTVGDLFSDTQRRQLPCGTESTLVNQCVMQDLHSGSGPSCPLLTILSF